MYLFPGRAYDSMSVSLISFYFTLYIIIMVTSSSAGTVQLSAQVSECLALDLSFFHFISASLVRHRAGDLGQVYGPDFESGVAAFQFGGRYSSVFEYECSSSALVDQQWLITSPGARDTVLISFMEELF